MYGPLMDEYEFDYEHDDEDDEEQTRDAKVDEAKLTLEEFFEQHPLDVYYERQLAINHLRIKIFSLDHGESIIRTSHREPDCLRPCSAHWACFDSILPSKKSPLLEEASERNSRPSAELLSP